jgi:hypothetical protein
VADGLNYAATWNAAMLLGHDIQEPEPPAVRIAHVELEAVNSGRVLQLHWRDLTAPRVWRQGWV